MRYMVILLAFLSASPAWGQFYIGGTYGGLGSKDPIGDETATEFAAGLSFGEFSHLEIQALQSSFDTGKNQIVTLAYYRDLGNLTFIPFVPYAGVGLSRISLSLDPGEHLDLLPTRAVNAVCADSSLWAGMAAVGGRAPVSPSIEFGVEFRFYLAGNLQIECDYELRNSAASREVEMEMAAQLLSFRATYRF